MNETRIEWTGRTWNPVTGCTKVSPGCEHCFAEKLSLKYQRRGHSKYKNGFTLTVHESLIDNYKLKKKTSGKRHDFIFINSMSDLYHEGVSEDTLRRVFDIVRANSAFRFQVLTKRENRLKDIEDNIGWPDNLWQGVSIENADYLHRVDALRETSAKIRWVFIEPLLGRIKNLNLKNIDWVVVGGETGYGARPMKKEWVIEILEQCQKASVPFFFKQWGGIHWRRNGRLLDGREWNDMPQ